MAVFPEAKLFSGRNFRVKNEIQNWIPEFASYYGMLADDHCGDLTDMMPATGTGTGSPAPSGHGTGHPDPSNARHGRTDRHRHGKAPATVETWRSAGTVAAGFKQKSRQPVREAGKGKRPVR